MGATKISHHEHDAGYIKFPFMTLTTVILLQLGSMMVTYLVVLLQLGIAGTSGRKDAANDTTSSPS
jgi:hypothetical protein